MDRGIARNASALLLVQIANFALPLMTFPYLVRVLGPREFGNMVFAQAVVAYFVLLTDYGFNLTGTKRIAENRDDMARRSAVFSEIILTKAALALLSFLLIILLIWIVPTFAAIAGVILSAFLLVIGSVLFPQWLFQGLERLVFVSICMITARLLTLPLTFLFVRTQGDAWIAALIQASGMVVAGLIALTLIWKHGLARFHWPSRRDMWASLKDGWHVFLSTGAISLYTTTNSVVLGFIAGPVQVGYFAAADKIRAVAQGLMTPLSNAVYPRISSLMGKDRDAAFRLIRKILLIQGGFAALMSLGIFLLAPWIVRIVMGGSYGVSVQVLYFIAFLPFVIGLSNVFGVQTMLTTGMKREFSYILICSGVLNLALLVPLAHLKGAVGAGIAVLLTEITVAGAMALFLYVRRIPIFSSRM